VVCVCVVCVCVCVVCVCVWGVCVCVWVCVCVCGVCGSVCVWCVCGVCVCVRSTLHTTDFHLSVSRSSTVLEPSYSLQITLRHQNPQAHVTNHPTDYNLCFLFFLLHVPICFHLPSLRLFPRHGR